jgi:aspartokinase
MKKKKTLVLGATAKPEKSAFKAITLLRKVILFLVGQNAGEVAGIKFKLKRFLKKHRYNHFVLKSGSSEDYYNYIVERSRNVCF